MDQKSPSVLSAVQKIRKLLTKEEKLKWLGIACFASMTSLLEIIAASVVMVFAQMLNQPEIGVKYLRKLSFLDLSEDRVVFYMSMFVALVFAIKNLWAAGEVFFQNFTIQKMNYQFKNKILHKYSESDYGFCLTRNSSLPVMVISEVDLVFSNGMLYIANILSESVVSIFLISMIIFMNPSLFLLILGMSITIGIFVSYVLLPKFYGWGQDMQNSLLHSSQKLGQFFHGFKEIILLGKRGYFIDSYEHYARKEASIKAVQTAISCLPRMMLEILFVVLFVSVILYLCTQYESPAQTIGILGGYIYLGFRMMPGLNRVINLLSSFKLVIPAIERVYKEYNTVAEKENYISVPGFTLSQSIGIDCVSFRYINANKDALRDLSFSINKGECIGIVGETGSGKSTLVDVLLGLLKPYKGSVLVDNKYPVNSYQWHQEIGYVPQSIYLIDDTIEANIAFGAKEINQERVKEAINAAQLKKLVDQLPDGINTIVGERGVRLSGGERQRISIARALYRNPEVLIFDEATSALDNETERKLMETIYSVGKNRTVIMVAHRLTTLKNCDRILVMEKGKLVKITSFEDLQAYGVKNHV